MFGAPDARAVAGADEEPDPGADAVPDAGPDAAARACVEIKISRRVRAESARRPPRHRCDAYSTAWRCRFLTARRSQHGSVIAEK